MTEYREVTPIPGPEEFQERGRDARLSQAAIVLAELREPDRAAALTNLRGLAKGRTLTLLTATKHREISEAVVLAELLRG